MPSPCSSSAGRMRRRDAYRNFRPEQRGRRLACGRPRPQGIDSTAKAGKCGLRGKALLADEARQLMATNPVWVCQAGRDMLFPHFTLPFESRWFCRRSADCQPQCPGNVAIPVRPARRRVAFRHTATTLAPDLMHLAPAPFAPPAPHHASTLWWGWPAWLPRSCRCAGRAPHILPSNRPARAARLCV